MENSKMTTSPIITTGIVPAGGGTEMSPQLARALAGLNDEDTVAGFGSFTGILPDLTKVNKLDLDNPDLIAALNRVKAQLNDPDGVISAFQSFTS